ncbi:beta-1,2-xylosyltransferase XYXT1-like isoform X2 [Hordeum vulgare subsp. vulgare]|uniref:Glycosyltransferase 61 catalytic domain-containing protein n=1 Tax=Hordeum vulgare subsp. vulgare TaxID=112509 RepID=A0A8I6YBT7_HORVV|nr:beta-1,2-xylosyltransferase XYXT1-like isoform X2 [Hordeum vulgare subsp. vulgare]
MMRTEGKATRSANRSSPWKSSYVAYGLLLGSLLVLLYLMVSTQLSYSQKALLDLDPAAIDSAETIPVKNRRSHPGQDDASRGMEEFSREEEEAKAKAHTEPSTPRRQEKQDESEQQWAGRNSIEEQLGNEIKSDNWEAKSQAKNEETAESKEFGGGTDDYNNVANAKPICDTSFGKYDICELAGDTRAQGGPGATVTLVSPRAPPKEWQIKPYSRKYLDGLKAVTVRSVPNSGDAPQCTTQLNIPAMVIELGGLTGNYWHDFTDVLVPLFIGARRFNGEVQLLVVNLLPFWVDRYKRIFGQISRHDIVDFENDDGAVRCYPHVVVGYGSRKEFTIDPSLDETGGDYTMVDFTKFLRHAYSLPRDRPIKLGDVRPPGGRRRRPRMIILERTNSRKILNLPEVIAAAEAAGFKVVVAGRPKASYDEFTREMNSFDVMVGVHGAGLTNCVYLPTGAVFLQIVPYGRLEEIAKTDFGDPARDMGLRYIEYSVAAEESSLMAVFGKEHPMIKDPAAIHLSGWGNVAEWYLGKQDVRINVERFRPSLLRALQHLR